MRLFVIAALIVIVRAVCWADARTAAAVRVQTAPRVDGILDDEAWKNATPIGDLVQKLPNSGAPASERTEIKIVYTSNALYIGVRCFDPHPRAKLVVQQIARDADIYSDDRLEINIDTFHDHRNAYVFVTNPMGAMLDARITENRMPQREWDGIWLVKTSIDDQGWSAEFEIPFKTLAFDRRNARWGFNLTRNIEHLREEDCWASPSYDAAFENMSLAGNIEGIEGVSQGVGLDIKPYGAGGYSRDIERDPVSKAHKDFGGDIFYRVTENLMASATFNTDFSQTEVDTRQINLTRFPLFFPEKRAFFLEDAGIFEFAPTGEHQDEADLLPFYSRRIGLVSDQEVPILFGTKASGKVGRFTLGVLDMKTRDSGIAQPQNFTVGRVKANFWDQSFIGGLYTRGDPEGLVDNSVAGVDMKLGTSNFLGRRKMFGVTLFGLKSSTTGVRGNDYSWGGQIAYPNDFLNLKYTNKTVEANFDPKLGFVQRPGRRLVEYNAQISPRPRAWGIRRMTHDIGFSSYYNLQYREVETRRLQLTPLDWEFEGGTNLQAGWERRFERLFEPFEIRKGINIPTGAYWNNRGHAEFNSPEQTRVGLHAEYNFGGFYTGESHEITTELTWRKSAHLTTSIELQQYFVRLDQGSFNTRLVMYRLDYSFTRFLNLASFLQYDTDSQNVGVQTRLRWVVTPGQDLFLVYNNAWQKNPLERWENFSTSIRAKFQYTFRF